MTNPDPSPERLPDAPDPARIAGLEQSYLRKLLGRLIPFLSLLYVFCLLDRGNVSVAALTMQADLGFSDRVYGLGAGLFFIGYFLFEVPSNLIMEKVGARKWIARIMATWGLISGAMMFVRDPVSFYVLRFLLGIAEAGFFPGILLYFTYWIPSSARARVIARFLALTAMIGIFGGPLGGLILKLDGWRGLQGWQWLFFLEAIPSVLLSFVVWKALPDTPRDAAWLTGDEKAWLAHRLAQDARTEKRVEHLSWAKALADRRVVLLCVIFVLTSTAGNMIGFFAPALIKARAEGAWSNSFVATVGVIPALVGAVAMLLAARHSDRTGNRRFHVVLGYFIAGLGFLLAVVAPNAWVIVAALAFNALGERVGAGSYWAVTTNLLGPRAAAGGLAFINSVGNLGGFFGPLLMGEIKERSGGQYVPGLVVATLLFLAASVLALVSLRHASAGAAVADPAPSAGLTDAAAAAPNTAG